MPRVRALVLHALRDPLLNAHNARPHWERAVAGRGQRYLAAFIDAFGYGVRE
jgi:hypothetical protein